ncbi:MAG: hypothetical protein JNK58_00750 [Phycisphaerae bacterium]|nr:hypothetical protein [Phycisphaerae bacterium]
MPEPAKDGLHAPTGPVLEQMDPRRKWSPRRVALQLAGLLLGLALLAWAIRLSMSEENARGLASMRAAPAGEVVALFALTFTSLILNGLMFWITLRPVHRLDPTDTILTNAIATFLSILPFKLSLIARVLIHHRRDGVRFRLLIGWVAAVGALAVSVLAPLIVAGVWRKQLDWLWWITVIVGLGLGGVAAVVLGRKSNTAAWLRTLSLGSYLLVQHPRAVIGHGVFRVLDVAVLAGRFLAAAMIINHEMPVDQAILLSTTYFLLSVLTPAGTLGFREMGVAALGISQGLDENSIALIALVVTGAEVLTSGALALVGAIRIRPDRLVSAHRP